MTVLVSIPQDVVAWQIPAVQVDRLRRACPQHEFVYATTPAARAAGLAQCDIAYTWILSAEELAAAPRLRWVHSSAVAVGTLCLDALAARGVVVTNTRGVQGGPIAEHVFATLLALTHRVPFALDRQRARVWAQNEFTGANLPVPLAGLCLGVVGLGSIGTEVARLGVAFGMRVLGLRRHPERGGPEGVHGVWGSDRLDDLVAEADVVVVAAPLTAETEALLDARRVARERGSRATRRCRSPRRRPRDRRAGRRRRAAAPGRRRRARRVDVFIDNLARRDRSEPLRWPVDAARGY